MHETALSLRNRTYAMFVELGRAPTAEEVATRAGVGRREVVALWRGLHDARALVLDPAGELRMANPFSAVPTAHRVHADGRWWYANCAWDAFGVCAALGADGHIETSCPDCGESLSFEVRERRLAGGAEALFHCLVPAALWWQDIGYT